MGWASPTEPRRGWTLPYSPWTSLVPPVSSLYLQSLVAVLYNCAFSVFVWLCMLSLPHSMYMPMLSCFVPPSLRNGIWGNGRGRSQQTVPLVPHAEHIPALRSGPPRSRHGTEHRLYSAHDEIQIWLLQEMSHSLPASLPSLTLFLHSPLIIVHLYHCLQ